jgi:16S rRNA C967 or C1407 C5-methylase (RsmB/RsmF family)
MAKDTLPEAFTSYTRELMGEERYERLVAALSEEAPVSIRLNPLKTKGMTVSPEWAEGHVDWCDEGYYLKNRPDFTFDPLLHAGVYYVQEASSMFISHVLRTLVDRPVTMLDLCAAPGGKSTAARAVLPEGSMLYSNEPIRTRAHILAENMEKWGHRDVVVTNAYPRDYSRSGMMFDVILCDVPCSGEGMFRKDEGAIREWSVANVKKCQQLQREIITEAMKCLKHGGYLIYSTCTYNAHENEENIAWMTAEYGLTPVAIPTEESWGITGPLTGDLSLPLYRFIPGYTRGEGLFMAALHNTASGNHYMAESRTGGKKKKKDKDDSDIHVVEPSLQKEGPLIDVDYATAIAYLRGEAVALPADAPRGMVTIGYHGFALGGAKNIGNRANNLYPKAWRIRSQVTHQEQNIII